MENINIRRSIRSFVEKTVEEEKIKNILRAGMQAPSACNQQPWEFIVVRSTEGKNEIGKINPNGKYLTSADSLIVLLNRKDNLARVGMVDQDMGACTQNMLLEVVEQGLGAVWVGVKSVPDRMEFLAKTLELPDNIEVFAIIALGYSEELNRCVDRFDETKIHSEKY